jgi:diguanylate cyclase (GGDEF)-like protein
MDAVGVIKSHEEPTILVAVPDAALRPLLLARLRQVLPNVRVLRADDEEALGEADLPAADVVLLGEGISRRPMAAVLSELLGRGAIGVILLAANPTPDFIEQALRAGASDCLPMSEEWLSAIGEVVRARLAGLGERRGGDLDANHKRLREQVRQLELRNAQLRELVARDPLTGLYNRRHFNDMLALLFAVALRHEQDLACLMFDLDDFKRVNDEWGHDEGDRLLILAAQTLKQNVRGSDVAARYGGDEFVALLPQVSADQARYLAERLSRLFEDVVQSRAERPPIRVTLSIGVASRLQAHAASGRELVAAADAALSEAKRLGKSSVILAAGRNRHSS